MLSAIYLFGSFLIILAGTHANMTYMTLPADAKFKQTSIKFESCIYPIDYNNDTQIGPF